MRNIPKEAEQSFENRIEQASRTELERWSVDPACAQRELAANELVSRRNPPPPDIASAGPKPVVVEPQAPVFDLRTEVSADAKYIAGRIVTNLWIIFVVLPFIIGVIVYLLR